MSCGVDDKLKLSVEDEQGRHVLAGDAGAILLGVLQDQGTSIGAVCGGGMICGTCHVFVRDANGEAPVPASEAEAELLELNDSYDPAASRLACQLIVDAALAACRIEVAPDE